MTATAPAEPALEQTTDTRFGTIAYHPDAELRFPLGLPGFAANRRFVLAPIPGTTGGLHVLHGLDGDAVDLVVVPLAELGEPVAAADLDAIRAELAIPRADLVVLGIVTLPARGDRAGPRVNLRAPIFVDVVRRLGRQVVLADARYPFGEPLRAA